MFTPRMYLVSVKIATVRMCHYVMDIEKCKWSVDSNSVYIRWSNTHRPVQGLWFFPRSATYKLRAHGPHESACLLVTDYFTHRKQRVKMGVTKSELSQVNKRTPQGFILGPGVINIFQNDFMYFPNSLVMYSCADVCQIAINNWRLIYRCQSVLC